LVCQLLTIAGPLTFPDNTDGFANFAVFSSQTSAAPVAPSSVPQPKTIGFVANFPPASSASHFAPPVPADKYSALAELESAFLAPISTPSTLSWDSFGGGSMTGGISQSAGSSSWGTGGLLTSAGASSSSFVGVSGPTAGNSSFYGGPSAIGPSSSAVYNVAGMGVPTSFAVPGKIF
jgi:hypothetical protein